MERRREQCFGPLHSDAVGGTNCKQRTGVVFAPASAVRRRAPRRGRPGGWRRSIAAESGWPHHHARAFGGLGQRPGALSAGDATSAAAVAAAVAEAVRQTLAARPADPDLMTIADISAALRCSEDTARRIPTAELPAYRVGKTNLYFREDVLRYVRNRQVGNSERGTPDAAGAADIDAVLNVVLDNRLIDVREPSTKRRAR